MYQFCTITMESLGNEGQGIGTLPSGKKVFVPGVLPGEVCDIEITNENNRFCEGRCINLISSSPDRIMPWGEYEPGADLGHLSYDAALNFKQDKVRGCLLRIGRIAQEVIDNAMLPIIPCKDTNNYRNHMQYKVVDGCLCLINNLTMEPEVVESSNLEYKIFSKVRKSIENVFDNAPNRLFTEVIMRGSVRTNELLIELVSGCTETHEVVIGNVRKYVEATKMVDKLISSIDGDDFKLNGLTLRISPTSRDRRVRSGTRAVIYGVDYYDEILLLKRFRIHAGAFFQVNIPQAELLYSCATDFISDAASILDLYCGTGSIGLSIRSENQKLFGIETVAEAIRAAKENASINGVNDATFAVKPAEKTDFSKLNLPEPMVVVVDPPRKGLDSLLIGKLLSQKPYKICYISCDPATMARDLKKLLSTGIYKIESVQACDMFPGTHHVETCLLLSQLD
ncbi:MAG: 23S rRNA (uracil(1939)-C(5))-methyltransferase RlmD [Saccharofermentans sp.]|nr:23S rRNA (uracil(1939)-C(5))-methyltransferase RlmD [Saccharofermentans sp.]